MYRKLEQEINESMLKEIELYQDFIIDLEDSDIFNLVTIIRSNLVIDGMNRNVVINVKQNIKNELSIIYLPRNIENVEIKNLSIVINAIDSRVEEFICCIRNNSKALKLTNCSFTINTNKSQNLYVIYNKSDDNTHMETKSDYLIVDKCNIKVCCVPNNTYIDSLVYGIYNSLANSISITNTFINIINKGIEPNQKAIGIFTNGRFGRIIGNNIKANSSHPEGLLLEQAHSYGIINEGLYTIISNNNIIAEWAGVAVSLKNIGDSALINGNKILATHTICGSGIKNIGEKVMITNNIIISTSKNAKLIEHNASNSIISHNHLEVLIPPNECKSGVGIYAPSFNIGCNTITENMICNIKDCGIFANPNIGIVSNNQVVTNLDAIKIAGSDNFRLSEVLNERNIESIRSGIDEET